MSEDGGQERPPDATPAAADVSAGGAADPEGGRAPEVKNQEGVLEDAARGLQDNRDDPSRVESTQSDFALDAAPPSHPLSDDSVSARPHDGGGPSENGKGGAPKTETAENVRLPFYDRPDPAGREQREQPEFEDPTVRLAPTGSGKPRFRRLKDSAQVAAGNLLDNGLVFIACAHQELAEAACLAVAYHSLIPKSRERRHWVPDDPRTLTELFASEDRVRSLGEKARQGDGGHDLVVVVHIHSADILRHLLDAAPRLRNAFWQSLRVGFIFVVTQGAAVQPPMVKELSWWEIDILTELIVDASGTEEDARRLSEDLNQGRQLGLWPQSLDQFATDVDRVLQNGGVEALQKEIGHRRDSQADERPDARAKACIESANLAERVALFVASFFPRCSVSDFQELYAAAANGRMVTVEQPSVGSDGKRVVEVTLTSYWEEHESRVMVRTKLRYAEDEDIVRIEFEEPAFGDAIRKALPKAFVLSCAKAVEKLLVNRRTPANVIGPIVELVRKQAEQFHNQYGADWLRTFLQIPPADPLDPSDDALPEGNTLDRIESICRALLSSPKTSGIFQQFIDGLVKDTAYGGVAANLLFRLRQVGELDVLPRYRKVLEVGTTETRRLAATHLARIVEQSSNRSAILAKVAAWHPKASTDSDRPLQPLERWSLALPFATHRPNRLHKIASAHDTAARLRLAKNWMGPWTSAEVPQIAGWLTHPRLLSALDSVAVDIQPGLQSIKELLPGDISVADFYLAELLHLWMAVDADGSPRDLVVLVARTLPKSVTKRLRIIAILRANGVPSRRRVDPSELRSWEHIRRSALQLRDLLKPPSPGIGAEGELK